MQFTGQPQQGPMQMHTGRLFGTAHDLSDLGCFQPFQPRQNECIRLTLGQSG
jgi:hypothetical protein